MNKRMKKLSEIKSTIDCKCKEGHLILKRITVSPKTGNVILSYSSCDKCHYGWIREGILAGTPGNITVLTDIIIPELILGE